MTKIRIPFTEQAWNEFKSSVVPELEDQDFAGDVLAGVRKAFGISDDEIVLECSLDKNGAGLLMRVLDDLQSSGMEQAEEQGNLVSRQVAEQVRRFMEMLEKGSLQDGDMFRGETITTREYSETMDSEVREGLNSSVDRQDTSNAETGNAESSLDAAGDLPENAEVDNGAEHIDSENDSGVSQNMAPDESAVEIGILDRPEADAFPRSGNLMAGNTLTPAGQAAMPNPTQTTLGIQGPGWSIYRKIAYTFLLKQKEKDDYLHARGTIHKEQILKCQKNLLRYSRVVLENIRLMVEKKKSLENRLKKDLTQQLTHYMVRTQLVTINGIGQRLAGELNDRVFRGDLNNLHRASQYVNGIGEMKQAQISMWVRDVQRKLPNLITTNFPGSAEIQSSYDQKIKQAEEQHEQVLEEYDWLKLIHDQAVEELAFLNSVTRKQFRWALQGGTVPELERYSLGVFAPWEEPPEWFVTLLNRFGG